jgi:hypothetical protein
VLVLVSVGVVAVALLVLPAPLLFTNALDLLELLLLPAPGSFAREFKVFKLLLFPTVFKGSAASESKVGIALYLLLPVNTKSSCVNRDTANFK